LEQYARDGGQHTRDQQPTETRGRGGQ